MRRPIIMGFPHPGPQYHIKLSKTGILNVVMHVIHIIYALWGKIPGFLVLMVGKDSVRVSLILSQKPLLAHTFPNIVYEIRHENKQYKC